MQEENYHIPESEVVRIGALWVVSKPSGLASHPSPDVDDDLLSWCRRTHGASRDLAPINRLDRATSGLVLASECPQTRASVSQAFATHQVEKTYLALVYGRIAPELTISRPLLDRRRGKKLEASTTIKRLNHNSQFSYIEVFPKTGRKHQIRRHLRGANHAIVGDARYGPSSSVKGAPDRLWLHCANLRLPNGMTFTASLPEELEKHLVEINLLHCR